MKLSEAAGYARLTEVDWELLSTIPYGNYVEVGTNHGASACAATQNALSVFTIDIFDWQPKLWETIWPEAAKKITFIKGTSIDAVNTVFKPMIDTVGKWIDVLFIDGSHEYEYVLKDCQTLVPLVKQGGTVLFHDHNPNNPLTGVFQAVNDFLPTIQYKAFDKVSGASNLLQIELL